jgi:hypothetical protein
LNVEGKRESTSVVNVLIMRSVLDMKRRKRKNEGLSKMTFVCPNCGYKDVLCWRSACWLKVATYCRIDELETWQPELAEKIKLLDVGETLEEKGFVYRLTRSGNVYRIVKELSQVYSSHGYTESPIHSRMKKSLKKKHFSSYKENQTRLLDVQQKEETKK